MTAGRCIADCSPKGSVFAPHSEGTRSLHCGANRLLVRAGRARWTPACALAAVLPLTACLSTIDGTPQEKLAEPIQQSRHSQLCAGQTPPGATDWQIDHNDVIHVDIDTSACGLTGQPLFFTSLGGEGSHAAVRGTTSIYRASPSGFRVVVMHPQAHELAKSQAWHVNWMARPEGLRSKRVCTGRTHAAQFEACEAHGVKVSIDISDCGFDEPPVLLTSLGGEQGHAATRGASSVYWVTPKKFTVFVQKRDVKLEDAQNWGWHVNWSAMAETNSGDDFCTGKTMPESTVWRQQGPRGLVAELATNGCEAPLVFTTLGGRHSHWYAAGTSSIAPLSPTEGSADEVGGTGFRVLIDRYRATPAFALKKEWHIHWTRVTPTLDPVGVSPLTAKAPKSR